MESKIDFVKKNIETQEYKNNISNLREYLSNKKEESLKLENRYSDSTELVGKIQELIQEVENQEEELLNKKQSLFQKIINRFNKPKKEELLRQKQFLDNTKKEYQEISEDILTTFTNIQSEINSIREEINNLKTEFVQNLDINWQEYLYNLDHSSVEQFYKDFPNTSLVHGIRLRAGIDFANNEAVFSDMADTVFAFEPEICCSSLRQDKGDMLFQNMPLGLVLFSGKIVDAFHSDNFSGFYEGKRVYNGSNSNEQDNILSKLEKAVNRNSVKANEINIDTSDLIALPFLNIEIYLKYHLSDHNNTSEKFYQKEQIQVINTYLDYVDKNNFPYIGMKNGRYYSLKLKKDTSEFEI